MADIVIGLLRNICSLVDYGIYSLAAGLYDTIITIAKINVFSGDINGIDLVSKISGNIYSFLGIFMIFRLAIGFIQYIMDPDKLTDSKVGGQKLVVRILTVIFLIVSIPLVFKEAIKLQQILLEENVVGKIIMGSGDISNENSGKDITFMIYKNAALSVDDKFLKTDDTGKLVISGISGSNWDKVCSIYGKDRLNGCSNTKTYSSIKELREADIYTISVGDSFIFEYRWLLSLIVGIFLCYVLLITCIDVALRSVKLAFYEMIAPVPIVSYLIPGQDGMLKKWSGDAIKTYLSVFITLAAFQFGFLLIIYLGTNINTIYKLSNNNIFIFLFLMLGILMFIKQLPEILKGMGLNISNGGYGLSLGKRIGAGAMIPGAIAGGVAGAITSAKARKAAGGGLGRSILSGIGGAAAGAFTGFKSGLSNKDGKGIVGNAMKTTHARANNIKNGTNFANRWIDKTKENLGLDKDNSQRNAQILTKENNALKEKGKQIFEAAGKGIKPKKFLYEQWKEQGTRGKEFAEISEKIDTVKGTIGAEKDIQMEMERCFKAGISYNGNGGTPIFLTANDISTQARKISDYEDSLKALTEIKDTYAKDGAHGKFVGEEKAMKYYEKISVVEQTS